MIRTGQEQQEVNMRLNYRLRDLMQEYGIGTGNSDWSSNDLRKHLRIGGKKFSKYITYEKPLDMIAKIKCFLAFRDPTFAPINAAERQQIDNFKHEVFVLPFLPRNLQGRIEGFLPEIKQSNPAKEKESKDELRKHEDDDKYKLNKVLKQLVEKYEIGSGGMSVTDFYRWLGVQQSSYHDYMRMKFGITEVNKIRFYLAFRHEAFAPSSMKELQYLEEMKDKINPLPFIPKEFSGPIEMSQFDHVMKSIDNEKFELNNMLVDLVRQYSIGMPNNMSISEFCDLVNIHSTAFQNIVRYRTTIGKLYKIRLFLAFRYQPFAPTNHKELVMARLLYNRIKPLPFLPQELKEPIDFSVFDIEEEEQVDREYELNLVLIRNIEKHGIGILPEMSITRFCKDISMSPSSVHNFIRYKYILGTPKTMVARIKFYLAFGDPAFAPKNAIEQDILEKWQDKIKPLPLISSSIIEVDQISEKPEKITAEESKKPVEQEEGKFKLNKILKQMFDDYNARYPDQMTLKNFAEYLGIPRTSFHGYINGNRSIVKPEHKIAIYLAFESSAFAPSTNAEQQVWQQMKDKIVPLSQKDVVQPDKAKEQAEPEPQAVESDKEDKATDKFELNRVLIQLVDKYKVGKGGISKRQFAKNLQMHRTTLAKYIRMERPLGLLDKIKLYLGFGHQAFAPLNDEEREAYKRLETQIKPLSFAKQKDLAGKAKDTGALTRIEKVESPKEPGIPALSISDLSQQVASLLVKDPGFAAKMCEIILGKSEFIESMQQQRRPRSVQPKQTAANSQVLTLAKPKAVEKEPDGKIIPAEFVAETRQMFNQAIRRLQELRVMDNRQRKDIQEELQVALRSLENEIRDFLLNVRAVRKTGSAQAAQQVYESEREFFATFKDGNEKT